MKKIKDYIAPTIELQEIVIEKGFTVSTAEVNSSIMGLRNFGDF